jgi:hypothetical protein
MQDILRQRSTRIPCSISIFVPFLQASALEYGREVRAYTAA